MTDVPGYLRPDVAATFEDRDVAGSYRHRPKYPPETFEILTRLIRDEPRAVLDIGCGTGFVARPLASLVDRVDAVDISAAMIAEGRRLPSGDHPRLTWIVGRVEEVVLHPPYALATAGDSLHWMDWEITLPRIAGALSPSGMVAILTVDGEVVGGEEGFAEARLDLIGRYTTFAEWPPPKFDLVAELERRGLFQERGRADTAAVPLRQPVDEYVESYHARASLSWQRMTPDALAAFDAEMRQLVLDRIGSEIELAVQAKIVWGKPRQP